MRWLATIFGRTRIHRDLSEEMQQHLEEHIDALVEDGMTRAEATAAARRAFGNRTSLEERGRDVWARPLVDSVLFDVRYALRQMRRQPSFTAIAVAILALGIGANTAVFSVLDTLLVQPLPFRAPERLVWIVNQDIPALSGRTSTVATYEALANMRSLEDLTTYEAFFARSSYKLAGDAQPDRVTGVMVPANFFPFLGISPMLGRTFTEDECQLNGPGAVLLSHALWQRRYSSDPGVIGRQVIVNDRAATVVGVMPPSFDFGAHFAPGVRVDIYMPVVFDEVREWGNTLALVGRLSPGVTLETAQAEATAIVERQQRERPEFGPPNSYGAVVRPLHESVVGDMRRPLLMLWGAVGLVLLIVCVNLSNLLLARGATRRKEMAVRSAIGAGRLRVARQLLTESLLLAAIGGGLGVAGAYAAVSYVRGLDALSIPLLQAVRIDHVALAVAAGVSVVTAVLFGLAPAIAAARGAPADALRGSGRASEGRDHRRLRSALVISEIALACLLLTGTGLLLRSFLHVLDVDLGFEAGRTYSLRVDAGRDIESPEAFRTYLELLIAAARNVPGVDAASITDSVPLDSNRSWGVRATGQPPEQGIGALVKIVGPGLMDTMRTPLVAGREFTAHDRGDSPRVALVNRSLAERLWPGQDPLLQSLRVANTDRQVVGVVADVRHLSVEASSGPEFYLPILQVGTGSPSLVVRTSRAFADVAPALRAALAKVVPDLPTAGFRPLQHLVDRALSPRRFFVAMLVAFATAALVLAAIGIYGVVSSAVQQRTPEIGIRMALGASRADVHRSIMRDTLRLALAGVALGAAGASVLSSLLAALLFDVSPGDPVSYAGAALVLLLVAAAAGFIPAMRASRISPVTAMRSE